jgi:hypothetical protein
MRRGLTQAKGEVVCGIRLSDVACIAMTAPAGREAGVAAAVTGRVPAEAAP